MKNKKLLVSLAIIAVVVVIIVVMASVFSVKDGIFIYHNFEGDLTAPSTGAAVDTAIIEKIAKGKSTVFLSKNKLLAAVNKELRANYRDWHAFAVVKSFPNILEVHLVKVTAIAMLMLSNGDYIYLDSFGCQVAEKPTYDCIDITSAFVDRKPADPDENGVFRFESNEDNMRLGYVLEAILATWQCYVEIADMKDFLRSNDPFRFDDDGNLLIYPHQGGTIELQSPETDLAARLHKAYGVYYNPNYNLQNDDWVITVLKNGRIKTRDPNKG